MEEMLSNPFWHALKTEHAQIAIGSVSARRYPADVIPFGGLPDASPEAMTALSDLLALGETIYVTGDRLAEIRDLVHVGELQGWQMHFPAEASTDLLSERPNGVQVRALGAADAPSMVALTDAAFPGYFRSRTYVLGSYYGIYIGGELISMAGERIALPGFREISAICTHPIHTGRGYAAILTNHILRVHAAAGLRSFLHVAKANQRAISLYERLGFVRTRSILFHRLRRA